MADTEGRWCLVVPVKRLALAKTRLIPAYALHRRDLALAFALDTTRAALASDAVRAVLVVTDEPEVADLLAAAGADVVEDEPDAGLNPALVHGAAVAEAAHPGSAVGALSADLPALRPDELTRALEQALTHEKSFVRDTDGGGTTLVLARTTAAFAPAFGPGSARRHAAAGFAEILGDDIASVRQDVDTTDDLAAARLLGLGAQTSRLLAGIREVG